MFKERERERVVKNYIFTSWIVIDFRNVSLCCFFLLVSLNRLITTDFSLSLNKWLFLLQGIKFPQVSTTKTMMLIGIDICIINDKMNDSVPSSYFSKLESSSVNRLVQISKCCCYFCTIYIYIYTMAHFCLRNSIAIKIYVYLFIGACACLLVVCCFK